MKPAERSPASHQWRYKAFISYSHADNREDGRQWATWLQREIERFHVPRELVGRVTRFGAIPRDLRRVFRDEDELSAGADLSEKLKQALDESASLVVLCSPRSAASKYVNEEVRNFKEHGKADRIFSLLIEGDPNSSGQTECFPECLRRGKIRPDGTVDWDAVAEPIAADVRIPYSSAQGYTSPDAYARDLRATGIARAEVEEKTRAYKERLDAAKLRLIAGILDIDFEDLKKRDAAERLRRTRRAATIFAGVGVALLGLAAIAFFQWIEADRQKLIAQEAQQRAEQAAVAEAAQRKIAVEQRDKEAVARKSAVRARGEAEELINFMLHDLRKQLEPLGRTRLLDSLAARAEKYFAEQPASIDDDALERNRGIMSYNRGLILLAQEGKLPQALEAFIEAAAVMESRLATSPDDPEHKADLALALDGIGQVRFAQGDLAACEEISKRQLALLPGDPGQAETALLRATTCERLGDVARRQGKSDEARGFFREQETLMRGLHKAQPDNPAVTQSLAISQERLGALFEADGQFDKALDCYTAEKSLLADLSAKSPGDLVLQRRLAITLGRIGGVLVSLGEPAKAMPHLKESLEQSANLARIDPVNVNVQLELAAAHQRLNVAGRALKQYDQALDHASAGLAILKTLAAKEPGSSRFQQEVAIAHADRAMTLFDAKPDDEQAAIAEFSRCADLLTKLSKSNQLDATGQKWLAICRTALDGLQKLPAKSDKQN